MTEPTPPSSEAPAAPKHRIRRLVAAFLVFVFAVSFLASGVGIWLHRNTLNRDVWNERVVPLGQDEAVQQALAAYTTDQLMTTVNPRGLFEEALPEKAQVLAVPLSAAVRDYVGGKVDAFFASRRFERLWEVAATRAHDEAVATLRGHKPALRADDDKIVINLIPIIDAVLAEVLQAAPGLVGSDVTLPKVKVEDVPERARQRLASALGVELGPDFGTITVYDGGKLSFAQKMIRWFDTFMWATSVIAFMAAAGALYVSPRRRRTLFQLVGAAALVAIAVRRVCFVLQGQVGALIPEETNRAAALTVVHTFVNPLTAAAATVLWVLALVALVAAITGPYAWARSLRASLTGTASTVSAKVGETAADPRTTAWIAGHVDALRIGGYALAAAVVWFAELSWFTFFLLAAALAAYQIVLARLATPDDTSTPTPA